MHKSFEPSPWRLVGDCGPAFKQDLEWRPFTPAGVSNSMWVVVSVLAENIPRLICLKWVGPARGHA